MVYGLIVALHVIVSLIIIGLVLLQAGKGADIGSVFGGGGSQAVFGSMGTPTVLGKLTTAVAVLFMITSFTLALLAHKRAASSIMPVSPPAASAPAPAKPGSPGPAAPTGATPAAPPAPAGATPAPAAGQK